MYQCDYCHLSCHFFWITHQPIWNLFLDLFCAVGSIVVGDGCQECPIGTYADVANGTSCTDCPMGTTTQNNGTSDPADCGMLRFIVIFG